MVRSRRACLAAAALALVITQAPAAAADYVVQPGDTLSQIADRLQISRAALAGANGIADPDLILVGQRLRLPGTTEDHVVRPGETLSGIAARLGVSVTALVAVNDITDPDLVVAGRRLQVPGDGPAGDGPAGDGPATVAPPDRAAIEDLLTATARRYGWNPATVKAVAMMESGWNNAVVSSAGAVGIMQVLPSTGDFVSRYVVGRPLDLHVPADNVEAGVAYLDYLYRQTERDAGLTLAGYYQGLASVRRHGMRPDTRHYVDTVLALRERYS